MGRYRRTLFGPFVRAGALAMVLGLPLLQPLPCVQSGVASEPSQRAVLPLRDVRVLIASGADRVRLRAEGKIFVADDRGLSLGSYAAREWIGASRDPSGGIRFGRASWPAHSLTLRPEPVGPVSVSIGEDGKWSPVTRYPGTLHLIAGKDGRLEVINSLDVETYVACVVANEVWPTFETEAYRAQAIAVRTFVLYHMLRRSDAAFDVVATQSSQVYRGVREDTPGRRAAEAARHTRGLVCTWRDRGRDRLFCAYYSAACGGMSQSAAIFGRDDAIQPLAGSVACDYCKIAPGRAYRWGPVRLTKKEVRSHLVSAYPDLASLGRIRGLDVSERTPAGRPVRLRITGSTGESREILAEHFRLAIGASVIRSTDCRIRVTGRDVIFEDGRGFGHGLGLCQWGMQGQARQGKQAGEILRYYYPG